MRSTIIRRLAATMLVALVLAGCANGGPAPGGDGSSPGAIAHPTGADQLVLRVATQGGFVAPTATFGDVPSFSLYGDGTMIVPGGENAIYPGPALPSMIERRLTEPGVQALLRAALDAGLARTADLTDLGSVGVADAPTTVFTLDADGGRHTVKVYALGILTERPSGMSEDEFAVRAELERFVRRLSALETWLPQGTVGAETPYAADGSQLYVGAYRGDPQMPEPAVAWPLPTALGSVGTSPRYGGYRCGVVTGSDWATVEALAATANDLTPWTSDGARFAIVFRPLLPDESTC